MKRLSYLVPSAVLTLTFGACGDDGPQGSMSTGANTSGGQTTTATDSGGPAETEGSDTEAETTGAMCAADAECGADGGAVCAEGFNCVACFCVEEPPVEGCGGMWGGGVWGDCLDVGVGACMADGLSAGCLVDDPADSSVGICFFNNCDTACDCPAPPEGANDSLVACDDIIGGVEGDKECFLDCSAADCPDGMFCFAAGNFCVHGEEPGALGPYGDCFNNVGQACPDGGTCLASPDFGWCTEVGCVDATECAAAPGGSEAVPVCLPLVEGGDNACALDCSDAACPDGMSCLGGLAGTNLCVWEEIVVQEPGFADCGTFGDSVCNSSETCVQDAVNKPAVAVCAAAACVDPAADCPLDPATGDAPTVCLDIDGDPAADECALDCSGAQTCPDGMLCADAGYCSFEAPEVIFSEEFEGPGGLPAGWLTQDEDGLLVQQAAGQLDFVDWGGATSAWAVSDGVSSFTGGLNGRAVVSASWYNPTGLAEDWLISPVIAVGVGANPRLIWTALAGHPGFPDGYDVRIVGVDPPVMDPIDDPGNLPMELLVAPFDGEPAFTVMAEEAVPTLHQLDVSAFAGQNIRVAWRNMSNDMYCLFVDDVRVVQ